MTTAPGRIVDIENEILNVGPERHGSFADNREKISSGEAFTLGNFLNPGGGGQLATSSIPAEGGDTTRRANKRCRPSKEETREKNRVKAKENRAKTKKKYTSLENQVGTLTSEKEDLQQEVGDLKCQNEKLLRENADLKRQLEEKKKTTPVKMLSEEGQKGENNNLKIQLAYMKGRGDGLLEALPHVKQVVVLRETAPVNSPSIEKVIGTVDQMAPMSSVPENISGGPTSQTVLNGTDMNWLLEMLGVGPDNLQVCDPGPSTESP